MRKCQEEFKILFVDFLWVLCRIFVRFFVMNYDIDNYAFIAANVDKMLARL